MSEPGRNDPCPCGSGRKYKKCCWEKDKKKRIDTNKQINLDYTKRVMEGEITQSFLEHISQAQDLVYDGWEALGINDFNEAIKCFLNAIKIDPNIADAYNGLADIAYLRGDLSNAEKYYHQAYEKAKLSLKTEAPEAFHWWGELETRPYMRARHGLGLVYLQTERFDEAIIEFKELLKRNKNDNQGIRYLVAPTYLLKFDITGAIQEFKWYEKHYRGDMPDPFYLANWGLALFLNRDFEKSAIKFRQLIFTNPYLIPLILKEKTEVLPIWHSINLMEIDYAYDYFEYYGELWEKYFEVKEFIRFLWKDAEIQEDYKKWIELMTKLNGLKDFNQRAHILNLSRKIEDKKPKLNFYKRLKEFINTVKL
ncbi:MAG: tetratricopeptide repeat protein [bacterium]